MAAALGRITAGRLGVAGGLGKTAKSLTLTRITPVTCIQVAHLRATYGEKYPYAKPYPYQTKNYNFITEWFDGTAQRMNENSKIIVVEGNVAVGKNDFAKRLARQFDMMYMPSMDDSYVFTIPDNGFDVRTLNELLPEEGRFYDVQAWLTDPHPKIEVAWLELYWFKEKVGAYLRAMQHVLNTGQGVVIAGSAFGTTGFVEAMRRNGYITKNFWNFFTTVRDDTLVETYRPHIMVYLEAPINVVRERLQKTGKPFEVNSKILSDKFLTDVDQSFKDVCLPIMRRTTEVLQLDWSAELDDLDMEALAEEMTNLKLEGEDREDPKFGDWYKVSEDFYAMKRKQLCNPRYLGSLFVHQYPSNCPELRTPDSVDADRMKRILDHHPAVKYEQGWAPEFGYKSLFKM